MGYTIAGSYVAACNCRLLCPCPVDGTPTGPGDQCHGTGAFRIDRGNLDDVDLGGTSFVLLNHFPSNLTAGNWKVGIVVDEGASEEQAQAIDKIVSGQVGGPFGEFRALTGDYVGMQRGKIEMSDTKVSIGGVGDFTYEQLTGGDGSPTTESNAMFGFAPEFRLGKTSGSLSALGFDSEATYGESADYEFSSEMGGDVHARA
ncbi:MAG: DUF1326 domain-containing protein [Actinomycetota bacterium]